MERSIVENIYKEKAKNDSNSRDLANSLNILSKTVFGDVNRFVFELLQNADDSSINGTSNKVEFRLYDNYLLFSHTGKHFDSKDVHGISSVGSQVSNKNEDKEKTGYKGIGFKSVFGSSNCVQVVSDKFKFKFDKNYHAWGTDTSYPWQVIPIWHENIPEELNDCIDAEKVNTIIRVENKELINSEILNVFEDCQIILFLRHISSISFYRNDEAIFEIHKEPSENDSIYNLIYNGATKSAWYLSDFILDIPDEVRKSISKLPQDVCPPKLKTATKTKLSLACLVEEESFAKLQDAILYSYLPTKVELDFPYLVNGDFLLNAERTQLLNNEWNDYLVGVIAWCQFNLFKQLSTTKYKYEFLNILKAKYTYAGNSFKIAFNSEYEKAIKEVKFIPDTSDNLVLVSECLVDLLNFSLIFPEEHIFSIYPVGFKLANLSLKNAKTLSSIGATSFDTGTIKQLTQVEVFKKFLQANAKVAYTFILFLRGLKQSVDFYKDIEFVLDFNKKLCIPSSLYFPSKSSTLNISFAETPFINNELLAEINSSNDQDTNTWLKSLDLTVASDIEVLRKAIFQLIRNDSITSDNTIEITRFAFNLFAKGVLTDNDYSNLRKIKFLTNNGMILATDCYLPDYYNPVLKLESLVPEHNYVSSNYVDFANNIPLWKQFFTKLFVKEKITVTKIDRIERTALVKMFSDTSNYFTWIDNNSFYDSIYYGYRLTGQHSVSNFRYFYFLDHLSKVNFAILFWEHILSNWDSFSLNLPKTNYITYRGGTSVVPDYLSYYSCNFLSIPCLDNKCYKSSEVYAPRFKKIIKDKFPVANFKGQSLSKEQIEYIGLKNKILLDDCISLLIELSAISVTEESKKQVFAIYEEVLKSYNEGNRASKNFSGLSLLSINNSFQKINDLYFFNVKTLTPPVNSDSFILLNDKISEENKQMFCKIFNITTVNDSDLIFVSKGVIPDDSLVNKLKDILGFLSVLVAHAISNDVMKVYTSLNQKIEATTFYKADNLALSYKTQDDDEIFSSEITSWFEDDIFYYRQNWDSPLALYSLTKSLCSFLSIDNLESELVLFLQISSSETCVWLTSKGYVVPDNFKIVEVANPVSADVINVSELKYIAEDDTHLVEEFIPESVAADANTSNLVVEKVPDSYIPSTNTKSYKSLKNDEVKINVGRWAEEYVNKYLNEQDNITSVNWLNQVEEAYLPYDFIIIQDGKEIYIEVKGTPSPDKGEFSLSKAEWALMFEKKTDYEIYRLYNVGKKDDLKMKIIPSPYTLIENGSILGQETISILI